MSSTGKCSKTLPKCATLCTRVAVATVVVLLILLLLREVVLLLTLLHVSAATVVVLLLQIPAHDSPPSPATVAN